MITRLVVAALPVLRRGLLVGTACLLAALTLCVALGAGVGWLAYDESHRSPEGEVVLTVATGIPIYIALLAAGGMPAFALALDGRPGLVASLRQGVRAFPTLLALAFPGLLGFGTFGLSVIFVLITVLAGPHSDLPPAGLVGMALFLCAIVVPCAHIWNRTFIAPVCAAVVEDVGFFEAFRRSDAAIMRRAWLLMASVVLPLAPFLVTMPDAVATSTFRSVGVAPTPLLVLRGVVAFVALVAALLLSCAFPIVAYALATNRPIAGYSPDESD